MQKFIPYAMETFRLLLVPPNDKVILFFDTIKLFLHDKHHTITALQERTDTKRSRTSGSVIKNGRCLFSKPCEISTAFPEPMSFEVSGENL